MSGRARVSGMTICAVSMELAFRTEGTVRDLDVRDLVSDAGGMLVGVTEFRGGV